MLKCYINNEIKWAPVKESLYLDLEEHTEVNGQEEQKNSVNMFSMKHISFQNNNQTKRTLQHIQSPVNQNTSQIDPESVFDELKRTKDKMQDLENQNFEILNLLKMMRNENNKSDMEDSGEQRQKETGQGQKKKLMRKVSPFDLSNFGGNESKISKTISQTFAVIIGVIVAQQSP